MMGNGLVHVVDANKPIRSEALDTLLELNPAQAAKQLVDQAPLIHASCSNWQEFMDRYTSLADAYFERCPEAYSIFQQTARYHVAEHGPALHSDIRFALSTMAW